MPVTHESVERILLTIPSLYRGPGGAIAVLHDGELVGQKVWGFADLDRRIPMTPATLFPICSTTKQMLCQAILDLERNPPPALAATGGGDVRQQLTAAIAALLGPDLFPGPGGMTIDNLWDMRSGLRDYWALCTLWGARPESRYAIGAHSRPTLARLQTPHFAAAAAMSYSNTNYHVLGRAVEAVTRDSVAALLAHRVFRPAGMATARVVADTATPLPGGCVGHEGEDEARGFVPARNRIEWAGDAGAVASLADMVAYERHFDGLWRDDDRAWYRRLAEDPGQYADGAPARYRLGLSHVGLGGAATVGHGGALRGFRVHRRYVPEARLSVVVLFNHEASAERCAARLIEELLGLSVPACGVETAAVVEQQPAPEWFGVFLDGETQLAVVVRPGGGGGGGGGGGEVSILWAGDDFRVPLGDHPRNARSRDVIASVDGDSLHVQCLVDNVKIQAKRVAKRDGDLTGSSFSGDFRCEELDSTLHCTGQGDLLYGAFDGFLGEGPPHLMRHVGGDVWFLADPRGMDAPAPGNWTVVFRRDDRGSVIGLTIGCWLARKLEYVKV